MIVFFFCFVRSSCSQLMNDKHSLVYITRDARARSICRNSVWYEKRILSTCRTLTVISSTASMDNNSHQSFASWNRACVCVCLCDMLCFAIHTTFTHLFNVYVSDSALFQRKKKEKKIKEEKKFKQQSYIHLWWKLNGMTKNWAEVKSNERKTTFLSKERNSFIKRK